ncbi:STAS domain-containing protein [Micromonospora olivasterospora]|uniref:STAS domain-containing protein n=1 Tax=Micromonospora olivasterospora TaxID=1880 RepID=UPI0011A8B97B|nr:STAS domain-containing protein [Micromonospora olivasterospora]
MRLALAGELEMATVETLYDTVAEAIAAGRPGRLVIDLAGVTFCDSTGIGALLDARAAANSSGVAFQATNPRGVTRRTMQITGVFEVLTGATAA